MNIFSAIIDAMLSFIRNNPLTVVIIVMLAVFVPSLFGAMLIGLLVVLLLLVAWPVFMLLRLRREARRMEKEASGRDFSGGYYTRREYRRTEPPRQRRGRGDGVYHVGTRETRQVGRGRLRRLRGGQGKEETRTVTPQPRTAQPCDTDTCEIHSAGVLFLPNKCLTLSKGLCAAAV